jgi:hypothetical protein
VIFHSLPALGVAGIGSIEALNELAASDSYGIPGGFRSFSGFLPLQVSEKDSSGQSDEGQQRYGYRHPITPYIDLKWRQVVAAVVFICVLVCGWIGFWYIQSAGAVEDISIRNARKLGVGLLLIVITWMAFHVAVDLAIFGRGYADHLFF